MTCCQENDKCLDCVIKKHAQAITLPCPGHSTPPHTHTHTGDWALDCVYVSKRRVLIGGWMVHHAPSSCLHASWGKSNQKDTSELSLMVNRDIFHAQPRASLYPTAHLDRRTKRFRWANMDGDVGVVKPMCRDWMHFSALLRRVASWKCGNRKRWPCVVGLGETGCHL